MRTLPLLLLVLLAGPAAAQKSGAAIRCQEDHTACKEDCTVEYGSSSRTYNKLGSCLRKCETTFGDCKERHFSLQQHSFDPVTGASTPPPPEAPTARAAPRSFSEDSDEASAEDPFLDAPTGSKRQESLKGPTPTPASTPSSEEAPTVERRGVYRATEATKPAAPPEAPAEAPAPEDEEAVAPAPPPPPPPKPAPPTRPSVPKEPKKKDISDWDPNEK
ncbi:hypothetical protein POL68_15765 [Stigmatella sp. ncwal1]|uniref:Uncharacterized protein n=1 Tax=Stigmatella ashevillensis TaxID=2995309 RepID=A0ABT5D8D8_9BACT|nr:hypothetical protein [Stigmatella ashevillena]MDC0709931.1 hypothetical protein [Stigmatella ashevillena]